jgi:hypothetical protein
VRNAAKKPGFDVTGSVVGVLAACAGSIGALGLRRRRNRQHQLTTAVNRGEGVEG